MLKLIRFFLLICNNEKKRNLLTQPHTHIDGYDNIDAIQFKNNLSSFVCVLVTYTQFFFFCRFYFIFLYEF